MPPVLYTILYILLFIFCLSVLITIHELGHLIAAKSFGVYCNEFSIGFGPALFHKKRKKGETFFSLRAIPFGGFVSMAGEGMPEDENNPIPKERYLTSKSKWKRAIIMISGIVMNCLLALVIFFCSEMFFTQKSFIGANVIGVTPGSIAETAGLTDLTTLDCFLDDRNNTYVVYDNEVEFYDSANNLLSDDNVLVLSAANATYVDRSYMDLISFYKNMNVEGKTQKYPNYSMPIDFTIDAYKDVASVVINFRSRERSGELIIHHDHLATIPIDNDHKLTDFGIQIYLYEHDNNFGEAVVCTFEDFGKSATAIFQGIASLFTSASAWQNTSGIIGIGFTLSNYLKNYGWQIFIYMWGLISVNLAIFNLLPFPGLDGWHFLVLIVEGVFRKEIPEKVKNAISTVGMIILFAFMILIVIKDVIHLF